MGSGLNEGARPALGAKIIITHVFKEYHPGLESCTVKCIITIMPEGFGVKDESRSRHDQQKSRKSPEFSGLLPGREGAFFINSPSHTAIPRAQIGRRASGERLGGGE